MRIALDAMGGDYAPREIVRGAVQAVESLPALTRIFLVGDRDAVTREMDQAGGSSGKLEVRDASEVVTMDETPALAVRRKKDSSIGRAVDLVKTGEADAVVSAGNTGAAVVASTLKLRTLEGIERPAIAALMPTPTKPFVLIDAGANVDSGPELLAQFAVMGSAYSKLILGLASPAVGLLSIGGEANKGTGTTKDAFKRLSQSPLNFKGNVEGHDLFKGNADVVVCDGFVGNVVLKTSESVATAATEWFKGEFKKSIFRILGAGLMRNALKQLKQRMDPESYGGALLLGVNGVCIITHGASSSRAIFHAIRVASESVHQHLNESIVEDIGRLDATL